MVNTTINFIDALIHLNEHMSVHLNIPFTIANNIIIKNEIIIPSPTLYLFRHSQISLFAFTLFFLWCAQAHWNP